MRLLHILSVSAFLLLPKLATANHIPDYERQLFIETWARLAVEQMGLYGVPASITLAQAIVESGWGKGTVAVRGNNYFCIKSNNGWTGPVIKSMDDELDSSSFRKYLNIEESFHDHSKFLRENSRYRPLFELDPTDYRAWAHGLKSCGYATADTYAEQLIATVEKYGLYLYDSAVSIEQIRALSLPFGEMEAAEETPAPAPIFDAQPLDNRPVADMPVYQVTTNERQQPLSAPGYQLGREAAPATPTKPAADASDAKRFAKIPLILPKSAPKFERR